MSHSARRSPSCRVVAVSAIALVLTACGGSDPSMFSHAGTSVSGLSEGGTGLAMQVYSPKGRVDQSGLVSVGRPEDLGGRVLEGNPEIYARVDYADKGMMAGIFKATAGVVEVTFPFTEHATILEGKVTITDETGQTHEFKPGDSYFIRKGQVVVWEVREGYVLKSFFNVAE